MIATTDSIQQFSHQPALIKPGAVHHYIKSNRDGSYPARIFIYVADAGQLEVLKLEAHGVDAAFVRAHVDWRSFSSDRLESWVLAPDGDRTPQATLTSSYEQKTVTIDWRGRRDVVNGGHWAVHMYNFDFISLNHVLPH